MKLREGLRSNDLRGMIKNTISIDEYQSKIDQQAIVIAFYVNDWQAAKDLNKFIQKSYVEILDSDLSSAPDQMGNYLIFVELAMNDKTASRVTQLCQEVNSLGEISKWVVRVRGSQASQPVDTQQMEKIIKDSQNSALDEFFKSSDLSHLILKENCWSMYSPGCCLLFSVDDFGCFDAVISRNKLHENAIHMSPQALRQGKFIRSMLGNNWTVECVGDRFAVYCETSSTLMLMQQIHS